jgi:hypothetical protein
VHHRLVEDVAGQHGRRHLDPADPQPRLGARHRPGHVEEAGGGALHPVGQRRRVAHGLVPHLGLGQLAEVGQVVERRRDLVEQIEVDLVDVGDVGRQLAGGPHAQRRRLRVGDRTDQ